LNWRWGFQKSGGCPSVGGARARCPALRDSKTQGKWTSTRARGESCANRPQVVQGTCAPTGAARLRPPDVLRLIRGRSSGSGETRATALPKPSAAAFAQVRLAANLHPCQSIASRLAIARGDMRSVSRLRRASRPLRARHICRATTLLWLKSGRVRKDKRRGKSAAAEKWLKRQLEFRDEQKIIGSIRVA
jgi:hypothetical protein